MADTVEWLSEAALGVFEELWNLLKWMKDKIVEGISCVFQKSRRFLWNIYNWLRGKLSYIFEKASAWAQDMFIAVTSRINKEIVTADSEADEILEASVKNNRQSQNTVIAGVGNGDNANKVTVDSEADEILEASVKNNRQSQNTVIAGVGNGDNANKIFKNAKTESALQNDMKKSCGWNIHPITSDLLDISRSLAEILGKTTLKDHQDMFEALSSVVKEEYKHKFQMYSKNLEAAKSGAGHRINIKAFNRSLGIKGDIKEHFWKEAMISVMKPRLAYWMKEKMENLEKPKKLLILPLSKQDEDGVSGVYRLIGIHGANKFTSNELINALKETQFDLSGKPVIKETSSGIMIRTEDLTFAAVQELNPENTAVGMLLVMKNEDLKKEGSILLTM